MLFGFELDVRSGRVLLVPNQPLHFRSFRLTRQPLIRRHIVDLAMQNVRPVEHRLGFRRQTGVHRLDRHVLERHAGAPPKRCAS